MNTRSACLSLALLALLPLAGCDRLSGDPSAPAAAAPLAMTARSEGEITSASPLNYDDGSRHQLYRLDLEEGQAVELKLSGSLPGRLAVFQDNRLVAWARPGDFPGGPAGSALFLAFRAERAGTYTVAVSGVSADAFGPFVLESREVEPYNGDPITGGGSAVDWLVGEQQEYTLVVEKEGLYDITLESAAFDTVLQLRGEGVEQENDDYGNGTHSRLRLLLAPGRYTAVVRSLDGSSRGAFRLALAPATLPEGTVVRDGTELPLGRPVTALVDSSNHRSFLLRLERPARVTLDARSSDFDTVLQVNGNGVEAEDDDGGSGTDSRLALDLAAGSYTVQVHSLNGAPGTFTLQARASDAP